MTREEAIKSFKCSNEQAKIRLKVEKMRMDIGEIKELEFYIERDEMAIKALENHDTFMKYAYSQGKQDALSQEPCTDAVSRDAVLDKTIRKNSIWNSITNSEGKNLEEIILELPSVTQKPIECDDAISRELILKQIEESVAKYSGQYTTDMLNMWGLFTQFIKEMPSVNLQPCEDAISREELLKAIDTWDKFGYTETGCFVREPKGDYVPYIHYDDVIKCIKGMPPVTQKSGKWLITPMSNIAHCSECDYLFKDIPASVVEHFKYCPNCGCRMVATQEREG